MISKQWWILVRFLRRLWVRATLYCVVAIFVALAAIALDPFMPSELPRKVGTDAVDAILSIIASSMLAVTTFSMTTLVSATTAASNNATPRATSLLLEDSTSQRALSTFLGSFLFSLVGLIALNTELYGAGGRFVLFIATLVVVALIVVTLLQWIDHLAGLGRVAETISRVERAASKAYQAHRRMPYLGCVPLRGEVPDGAIEIQHNRVGYLQHLDIQALSSIAEEAGADIYVRRRPGGLCDPSTPIAGLVLRDSGATYDPSLTERIRAAFTLGERRSYDQDPRFGLIALSEIGSRALSPGLNDPGTAIDVLATLVRVLLPDAEEEEPEDHEVQHPHVHLTPLSEDDLIDSAFMPISRDGAGMIEIAIRLQKALAAVAAAAHPDLRLAATRLSKIAERRALEHLDFEVDRERLTAEVAKL
ncbi:putative membrane protein [Pseudorhizobium tarimense]|uniref:Membrane protein n=1 Tax=Pseudorhizobium tarimense TaxID=1079109 RepID=A0ABV2H0I4_9HYPH|nr:DUF2254 domain-containing protein [Pseudorhizobium tarimense]MCJ8517381.1 DUF2254 domain-containing protein [Pseudorhizobium tarimense]